MPIKDVWRSATTMYGEQCVMTHSPILMRKWPADNWDSLQQVHT